MAFYPCINLNGGGGSSYTSEILYSNSGTSVPSTISLSKGMSNYDAIVFSGYRQQYQTYWSSRAYLVSEISAGKVVGLVDDAMYAWYTVTDDTTLTLAPTANIVIDKVYGLKFSSGGSGGASALEDLTDVNINNPTDGQVLKYDATNDEWVNDESDGVADVTVNGVSVVDPNTGVAAVMAVTGVTAGTGLNGGTIRSSGTMSVKYGSTSGTACQGNDARLSDTRLPKETELSTQDLNDIITPGFYYASSSNSSANKPNSNITAFGMLVIHDAYNTYYCTQILYDAINQKSYKRYLHGGTNWTSWVEEDNIETLGGKYVKTHPEDTESFIIPFINNDIAHLLKRGGSAVIKYDGVEQTGVDITNWFDGSPNYWIINPTTTGVSEIVAELTLHQTFTYSNYFYVDFGTAGWRAKNVKVEVKNTNYPNDVWTQKYADTDLATSYFYVRFNHTPVGASGASAGFNSIRLTFSSFNNASSLRIAQVGVIAYNSIGIRNVALSRAGGTVYGSIAPATHKGANLGYSDQYWTTAYIDNVLCNRGTVSGDLYVDKTSPYATNSASTIILRAIDSTNSTTSSAMIRAYQAGASGANMVIHANGNLFIGGGEAPFNHQALYDHDTNENTFITSDGVIHFQGGANTIGNRKGMRLTTTGGLVPEVADVATDNVGTIGAASYRWANGYFVNINGVEVGNSPMFTDTNVFYGTCSTEATTAEKAITLTDATNFSLRAGVSIVVKFTNTNTAQNPTLNVNSTGAKSVWFNTAIVTTSSLNASGQANRPIQYVYDGTNWVFMGWSADNNTTYSAMSTSELTTGTATNARSVRADYLNAGIKSIINEVNPNPVYRGSLTFTTGANGAWSGSVTIDGYGLKAGDLLSAYVEKGSLHIVRSVEIRAYGTNGYTFIIKQGNIGSETAVANTQVTLKCSYTKS